MKSRIFFFFFNDTATTEIYTLSLHDALPIRRDGAQLPSLERNERRQIVVADAGAEDSLRLAINARREDVLTVADELGNGSVQEKMELDFVFWPKGHFQGNPLDRECHRGCALRLKLGGPPGAAAVRQGKREAGRFDFPGQLSGKILDLDFFHRVTQLGQVRMSSRKNERFRAQRLCSRRNLHLEAAIRIER